jgi:hypothetical protein
MNEYDELTQLVIDEAPEPAADNSPLRNSTIAYHLVVFTLDIISGYIVGFLTIPVYGVIWFFAGAVAFFQHHKNWESPTNNDAQLKNSTTGLIVSVSSVVIMALLSGAALMLQRNGILTIQAGYVATAVELITVSIFCWNGFQFAMYRFADDSFITNRQIKKAQGNADKKVEFARAAGRVVAANQRYIDERNSQRNRHGGQAVDASLARMQNRVPVITNASTVDMAALDPKAQSGQNQN